MNELEEIDDDDEDTCSTTLIEGNVKTLNRFVFSMPFGTCVEPHTMHDALNYLLAVAGRTPSHFCNKSY